MSERRRANRRKRERRRESESIRIEIHGWKPKSISVAFCMVRAFLVEFARVCVCVK